MYKHSEDAIDPRDKQLITWNKESRRFIVEASTLSTNGIEPRRTHPSAKMIWLWSNKHEVYVPYKKTSRVLNGDDVAAEIYTPYWWMITTNAQTLAMIDSRDTELHIIND